MKRIGAWLIGLALLFGAARAEAALCVAWEGLACLVSPEGETLLSGEDIEAVFPVREGALYAAGRRGAYRLYDAAGNPVGDAEFGMIFDEGDGLIFRQGSRYGAMDAQGRILLPAAWTQLTGDGAGGWLALETDPLDEGPDAILRVNASGEATPTGAATSVGLSRLISGRMPVMTPEGRWGAIDGRGEWAIPATWLSLGAFENGRAKVAGPEGLGLIDPEGIAVIPPVYRWLERSEGLVAALRDDGLDMYAPDGEALLYTVEGRELEVSLAGDFVAVTEGGRTRLYGASGAVVHEADAGITFSPGVDGQLIASDGQWGERCAWLMDPDGSAASGRFQRILPLGPGRYAFIEMEGVEYYSEELGRAQTSWNYDTVRYGLMDGHGAVIMPAEYREIRAVGEDRLLVVSEDEIRLTDADGGTVKSWERTISN